MIVSHEIIDYTSILPVKLSFMRIGHAPMHWHSSLEILYVLSGTMTLKIENSIYQLGEDDIALVNPNQIHETDSPDCTLIVLQLRLSMFHLDWLDVEALVFDCNSSTRSKEDFRLLKGYIARLIHSNANTPLHNELLNYAYANQLMHELLTNFRVNAPDNPWRSKKHLERLKAITSYIEENYPGEITLTSVAAHEYLTPAYLSHFFEKHMGVTFSDYLAKVRVSHSIADLLYTDLSIEETAAKNGFASARAYAAAFRKFYGCLPSKYRKDYQREATPLSSLTLKQNASYLMLDRFDFSDKINELLQEDTAMPSRPSSPAILHVLPNISVLKEQRALKHTWRSFCSVGRAREMLYSEIQEMLRVQQREIGFRHIKFHGIFDDALGVYREDSLGNPAYSFTYVDKVLDFILSVGLKPMIQLSFMPKALALDTSKTIFQFEFYISPPKDERKWYDLVSAFTRHVINRYGNKEVMEWIFTFWNEALDYLPFRLTDKGTTLRLYELSYLAVKECNPDLTFASLSVYHEPNMEKDYLEYLDYAKSHSCEPDAYLFHFYPTRHDSQKPKELSINSGRNRQQRLKLHCNPDAMKESLHVLRQLIPDQQKPIYITEWNLTPSHRELLNDTCYSSCYIIKNILENYDAVDSFCHWSLTDWIEELEFAPELFHGGMGFFTKNGIKKPAYYAYYFLNKLEDTLVEQGDGYFITKGNDRYVLLFYNYIHFSDLYADGIVLNSTFTERYKDFASWNQVKAQVTLTDLPDGSYDMLETVVNRRHGSAFDQWVEMGALEPKYQEEVDTLKFLSQPMVKRSMQAVSGNTLSLNLLLEPLEIRLIELMPH
ncbi:MAG TPA: helix-turn-helix domain-containing protein [Clostridiales bacterium]|nr:helix-turn-helix domain-containing protein [Clostridiales bacterium]